jgi:hypothetical protein
MNNQLLIEDGQHPTSDMAKMPRICGCDLVRVLMAQVTRNRGDIMHESAMHAVDQQ